MNIFILKIVREDQIVIFTPFATSCLPGITRNTILEMAERIEQNEGGSMRVKIEEKQISLSEIYTANEVFTTGTMVKYIFLCVFLHFLCSLSAFALVKEIRLLLLLFLLLFLFLGNRLKVLLYFFMSSSFHHMSFSFSLSLSLSLYKSSIFVAFSTFTSSKIFPILSIQQ